MGEQGTITYRKRSETNEDGKTRIVDAPAHDGKARLHCSGGRGTFLAWPTSIYKAIRQGRLRIRKYGTRTIITRTDLASFLESLPDEG